MFMSLELQKERRKKKNETEKILEEMVAKISNLARVIQDSDILQIQDTAQTFKQ